jgi:hypothetical protein
VHVKLLEHRSIVVLMLMVRPPSVLQPDTPSCSNPHAQLHTAMLMTMPAAPSLALEPTIKSTSAAAAIVVLLQ